MSLFHPDYVQFLGLPPSGSAVAPDTLDTIKGGGEICPVPYIEACVAEFGKTGTRLRRAHNGSPDLVYRDSPLAAKRISACVGLAVLLSAAPSRADSITLATVASHVRGLRSLSMTTERTTSNVDPSNRITDVLLTIYNERPTGWLAGRVHPSTIYIMFTYPSCSCGDCCNDHIGCANVSVCAIVHLPCRSHSAVCLGPSMHVVRCSISRDRCGPFSNFATRPRAYDTAIFLPPPTPCNPGPSRHRRALFNPRPIPGDRSPATSRGTESDGAVAAPRQGTFYRY